MELNDTWLLTVAVAVATYCSVELYKRLAKRFGWPPTTTAVVRDLVASLLGTGAALLQVQEPLWVVVVAVINAGLAAMLGASANAVAHRVAGTVPGLAGLQEAVVESGKQAGGGYAASNF